MPKKKRTLRKSASLPEADYGEDVEMGGTATVSRRPSVGYSLKAQHHHPSHNPNNNRQATTKTTNNESKVNNNTSTADGLKTPTNEQLKNSPPHTPTPLSLNDVFELEGGGNHAGTHRHGRHLSRADSLVDSETDEEDAANNISVLHRFRMALRDVGSEAKDAETFIADLRHQFCGDWDSAGPESPSRQRPDGYKPKPTKKNEKGSNTTGEQRERSNTNEGLVLREEDLRTRVQHLLKDSNISDFEVEEIFETIDADGSGTIEWEEFLSFLSLSPASLRLVITKLQQAFKHDLATKYNNKMEWFFKKVTDSNTYFEYEHLEKYLNTHEALSAITLTPGEINWLHVQMCGDHGMFLFYLFVRARNVALFTQLYFWWQKIILARYF